MDDNIENIINEYNSITKVKEDLVHCILRKLFSEYFIFSTSEDKIFAETKNIGTLCEFFNIPYNELKLTNNPSGIEIGRTDILLGNLIIEIKNVKSWANALKLLVYKRKECEVPVALFFNENKDSSIPHDKKYIIYKEFNKFDIVVIFFDDLMKDLYNFREKFISCIEFNLKYLSDKFREIAFKEVEDLKSIRVTRSALNNARKIGIFNQEHVSLYKQSIGLLDSLSENMKCADIKSETTNIKCVDAYAALSTYNGKITLVKHAIGMKASNFDEMIKISLVMSKDNILKYILSKHNHIKDKYINYCNKRSTLELIENLCNNKIDYDKILDTYLSYKNIGIQRVEYTDIIVYLLEKTNRKSLSFRLVFTKTDVTNIIIKKRINITFDYKYINIYIANKYLIENFLDNLKQYKLANKDEFLDMCKKYDLSMIDNKNSCISSEINNQEGANKIYYNNSLSSSIQTDSDIKLIKSYISDEINFSVLFDKICVMFKGLNFYNVSKELLNDLLNIIDIKIKNLNINSVIDFIEYIINHSNEVESIIKYKNIMSKIITCNNMEFICKFINNLKTSFYNKKIKSEEYYEQLRLIFEANKYSLDKLFITFFNTYCYTVGCFSHSKFLDDIVSFFINFPYIEYMLKEYNKYLNIEYLCLELIKLGNLFLIPLIIQYGNINSNKLYENLTFSEYKIKEDFYVSKRSLLVKYSYIEFYRFIIYTSTVSPNDIALKAVKANNINVLKMAIEKGANNMKKLLTICKKNSKIHSLLKNY